MRFLLLFLSLALAGSGQINVLTANYTIDRAGANLNETLLTPGNVSPTGFGKIGSFPVDGQVFGQPLYVSGLSIPGNGTHNVLYIATMHNSVYAYDADSAASPILLWQVNLGPSVPTSLFGDYNDISPEVGLLSTGAIDLQGKALYVVSETMQTSGPAFQVHALDLTSGQELMNGPTTIAAQAPGNGPESMNGVVAFDPLWQLQRPGLLLANNSVYLVFGSHGDQGIWHGWLLTYNMSGLSQPPGVFLSTPDGNGGSIWQAGRGLAADNTGSVYAISGNGDYDGLTNFGESFFKFSPTNPVLADWYTPPDWSDLSGNDSDLSGGAALIPGTHLIVGGDKSGQMYLVNGDAMGHGTSGTAQIFQPVQDGGIFNMAIWNRGNSAYVYIPERYDTFKCFQETGGSFNTTPVSLSKVQSDEPYDGMAISANGSQNGTGILWVTTSDNSTPTVPGTLHALDASDLTKELWNSDMSAGRDTLGAFAKWVAPLVVNGTVYVGTWSGAVD